MNNSLHNDQTQADIFYDEIRVDSVEFINELNRQHGWSVEFRQMNPGRFKGMVDVRTLGDNVIAHERYNTRLDVVSTPPEGKIAVAVCAKGNEPLRLNGMAFSETNLLLIWPGAETYFSMPDMGALYITHLDSSELLESLELRDPSLLRNIPTEGAELYSCRSEFIENLRTYMRRILYGPERNTVIESETSSMFQSIVFDTLATAFHHSKPDDSVVGTRRSFALKTREYIDANYHRAVFLNELSNEVHAGPRTLERAFSQTFGITVRSYIKLCRLNAAHRALIMSDREFGSVTDIAFNSGFNHLGRFSVEYKRLFGESPSESLRR